MKILIIVDGFEPSEAGGITKSLLNEIHGLVTCGHEIVVVAKRLKKDSPSYQNLDGYEVYRYFSPSSDSLFYRTYPLFSFTSLPKIIHMLYRKKGFDIAYVHNSFQVIGLKFAKVNIPIVYNFHAPMSTEIKIDAKQGKYGGFKWFLEPINCFVQQVERHALQKADIIVVHSEFMKNQIWYLHGIDDRMKRMKVIPLAVDTEHFNYVVDPSQVRKHLCLPEKKPILLTVRRLVARMGLKNLIEAMKHVKEKHPDTLLLIGGKGYLKDVIQRQIVSNTLENNVQLLGFIPEEKLSQYYQAADFFVLPTVALEGFGVSTIEALACGTPVIGTPIGATPEVIGPIGMEFLCKDSTPEAIAERILWWLDKGLTPAIRRLCREYCISRFSQGCVIPRLEKIFTEVAEAQDK